MSALWSQRFGLAFTSFTALGAFGVTLMISGYLWIGILMVALGIFIPLPLFLNDLKRVRVILTPNGEPDATRESIPADLWGYLTAISISVLVLLYVFVSETAKRPVVGVQSPTIMQGRQPPRRLTNEQKIFLISKLKGQDQGRSIAIVTLRKTSTEPAIYAADFYHVFEAAGWKVERELYPSLSPSGIVIHYQANDPVAEFLLCQLQGIGIEVESYPVTYSDHIKIRIAPRLE